MSYDLISLTDWPTMPTPLDSKDAGEAWVWGDFVAVLQKEPQIVAQGIQGMMNGKVMKSPMEYPYAMTVYYRKDKNPHGPSNRPIMTVGLEQPNMSAFWEMLGENAPSLSSSNMHTPLMVGMFTSNGRKNFGKFTTEVTEDSARSKFFEILRAELNLSDEPTLIGTIDDIHGHPDTGWPDRQGLKKRKKNRPENSGNGRSSWKQAFYWICLIPGALIGGAAAYWAVYFLVYVTMGDVSDSSLRSKLIFLGFGQFAQAAAVIYCGAWLASPSKRRITAWVLGILQSALFLLLIVLVILKGEWGGWDSLLRGIAGLLGVATGIKISKEIITD